MKDRVRESRKYVIAASGGDAVADAEINIPAHMKKHIFQTSASVNITPVLLSGSDGTAQAIAAGETWETTAPLRGFKSSGNCSVFWVGESI